MGHDEILLDPFSFVSSLFKFEVFNVQTINLKNVDSSKADLKTVDILSFQ